MSRVANQRHQFWFCSCWINWSCQDYWRETGGQRHHQPLSLSLSFRFSFICPARVSKWMNGSAKNELMRGTYDTRTWYVLYNAIKAILWGCDSCRPDPVLTLVSQSLPRNAAASAKEVMSEFRGNKFGRIWHFPSEEFQLRLSLNVMKRPARSRGAMHVLRTHCECINLTYHL